LLDIAASSIGCSSLKQLVAAFPDHDAEDHTDDRYQRLTETTGFH